MSDDRLRADCARCAGLCCVAPAFARSADFAIDKPAGHACPNLRPDFRCGIHERLRDKGFPGCASYDCFGAGQHVVQVTFGGRDWRSAPEVAPAMFAAFTVVRGLHELIWYVTEALALPAAAPLHGALRGAAAALDRDTRLDATTLAAVDTNAHWKTVNPLLLEASELVRIAGGRRARDRRGADLAGAKLAGANLAGASLRGAVLLGADLRRADLRRTDLIGADLRGADLAGADLTGAIFVTQAQLDSATGDVATRLPAARHRPGHWIAEG